MLEQHSNLHNILFACLFEFLSDLYVSTTIFIFILVCTTIFFLAIEHLFARLFEPFFYLQTCFLRMSSSQSWHHLLEAPLVKSVSCPSLRQLWWKWHINLKWWHVACICVYLESKFWTCVYCVLKLTFQEGAGASSWQARSVKTLQSQTNESAFLSPIQVFSCAWPANLYILLLTFLYFLLLTVLYFSPPSILCISLPCNFNIPVLNTLAATGVQFWKFPDWKIMSISFAFCALCMLMY